MRVYIAASILVAYASGQTCGDAGINCGVGTLESAVECSTGNSGCDETLCCTPGDLTCGVPDGLNGSPVDCGEGDGSSKSAVLCSTGNNGCDEALCCVAGTKTCGVPDGLNGSPIDCGAEVAKPTSEVCGESCDTSACCLAVTCGDITGASGGAFNCGIDEPKATDTVCSAVDCDFDTCCTRVKSCLDTTAAGDSGKVPFDENNCPGSSTLVTNDVKCASQSAGGCLASECCTPGPLTCGEKDGMGGGAVACNGLDEPMATGTSCAGPCDEAQCCAVVKSCRNKDGADSNPVLFDGCQGSSEVVAVDVKCSDQTAGCAADQCCTPGPFTCGEIDGMGGGKYDGCGGLTAKTDDTQCQSSGCSKAECCVPAPLTCGDKDGLGGGAVDCGVNDSMATDTSCTDPCDEAQCCTVVKSCLNTAGDDSDTAFVCEGASSAKTSDVKCASQADGCTATDCCDAGLKDCDDTTGLGGDAYTCPGTSTDAADRTCNDQQVGCTVGDCCDAGTLTCGETDGLGGAAFDCGEDTVNTAVLCSTGENGQCDKAVCCTAAQDDDSEARRVVPVAVGALLIAMAIF